MKKFIFLFTFLFAISLTAQERPLVKENFKRDKLLNKPNDTIGLRSRNRKSVPKQKKAKIDQYLIISREYDTTYVDTSLTITKDYKFNYLRNDDFDVLPFQNIGQTYNTLSYDFSDTRLTPRFAARAKHFNFKEMDDINYYRVPTPLTELTFKTAFEQGQLLESFFTVNTSERFNFSIAYKGLRSLGKYQHTLSSTGNFSFTTNYRTKNNRYNIRGHIVMQDTYNDENGGISDEDLEDFENGNPEFTDRSLFDPIFENANNELRGKRFHLEHNYNIVQQNDSLRKNYLSFGNKVTYNDKYYQFLQSSTNSYFGDSFTTKINDKVKLEDFYGEVNVQYKNKTLGGLKGFIGYNDFNYGYDKIIIVNSNTLTNRIKGQVLQVGGEYKNKIGEFIIYGKAGLNIAGDLDGNYIDGKASYNLSEDYEVEFGLNINSKAPNYNYQLYQSDYINYNWYNNFENVQTKQ
ncbi:MAG: putative porin, partial [Bacteroidia bacterium]|nr:putative porin [Bacteroidia bacterium]